MIKKYLSRKEWPRVLQRKYASDYIDEKDFAVSLIQIMKVSEPCIVKRDEKNGKITIIDEGYYWLQIAPKNQHWWCTVVFDKEEKILQYYFDITKENDVRKNEDSSFWDLYLDIVMFLDGSLLVLDEDELLEAFHQQDIEEADVKLAYRVKDELVFALPSNEAELRTFSCHLFDQLKEKLS